MLLLQSHVVQADHSDSLISPEIPTDLSSCLYLGGKSYSDCDTMTRSDPTQPSFSMLSSNIMAFAQQGIASGIRSGGSDGIDVAIPIPNTNYSIQNIHLITGVRRLTQQEIDSDPVRKAANQAKLAAHANGFWAYHHIALGPEILGGFPNINKGAIGGTFFPVGVLIDQPAELDFVKWYPLSHPAPAETDPVGLLQEVAPVVKESVAQDIHFQNLMSGKSLEVGESAQLIVKVGAEISLGWLSLLGQIVNHLGPLQFGGLLHPQLDCEKKILPSHSTSVQRLDPNTVKVITQSFHNSTCDLAVTAGPEVNLGPVINIGYDLIRYDPFYHFTFWETLGSFKVDGSSKEGQDLLNETRSLDITKKLQQATQAVTPIATENINDLHGSGWAFNFLPWTFGESHGQSNLQETNYTPTGTTSVDMNFNQYRFESPNYQATIGLNSSPDGTKYSAWIHSQRSVSKPTVSTLLEVSRFANFMGHSTDQAAALQSELTRWSGNQNQLADDAQITFYVELDSVALSQFMNQSAEEGEASLRKGWTDIGVDPNDKAHEELLNSMIKDFKKYSKLPDKTKRAEKFISILKKNATDPYVVMAIVNASGGTDHVLAGSKLQITEPKQPQRVMEFVFKGSAFSPTILPVVTAFPDQAPN
jgi:hypothetical protein